MEVTIPSYSDTVNQAILIEPITGPRDVFYYLNIFPEEIYNKSPDSHLYKFLRAMLGESGVNWIRKNQFQARLMLEELGIDMFDLDKFFGAPFAFGRIVEENLAEDPYGVIDQATWELIRAKNARYRNRALDYMNGARAGNTKLGMRLVARSGLGHDVEIVENYRFLFDVHSDDPLGLHYYGQTLSTEEMIVLPRQEVGQSEQQMIFITPEPDYPTSGDFFLVYNGVPTVTEYTYNDAHYTSIPFDATRDHVRLALEKVVGKGNVKVDGGPGPMQPWLVTFTGKLANADVPALTVQHSFAGAAMTVRTLVGGSEAVDEVVNLAPKEVHNLQDALDRIRAQTTIPTVAPNRGNRSRTAWNQAMSTSQYTKVLRFVTGNPNVLWPSPTVENPTYWIESGVEKEALSIPEDRAHHYTGWHTISRVEASTVADLTQPADRALADSPEPLLVTAMTQLTTGKAASFVNDVYPSDYKSLPGVPLPKYRDEQTWVSQDWDFAGFTRGQEQDEWLVFRFPFVKAVNYVSFEMVRDDIQVDFEYDAYDGVDQALWVPVNPVIPYSNTLVRPLDGTGNPWASVGLTFTNAQGNLVWTRALRMKMRRTDSSPGHWGYPIVVRNFRAARNVA